MPTYQYSCTDCGHFFEQFQSFSEDSLTVCPECEGRLRKVFNAVGVVFKGSGFYRTDSRADSRTDSRSAETTSTGTGDKPATKAGAGASDSSGASSTSTSGDGKSGGKSNTTSGSAA